MCKEPIGGEGELGKHEREKHVVLLLKNLAVCRLRESKVHEFIQKLVHHDKVILNTLLLQLLKILCEDLNTHIHKKKQYQVVS